MRNTVYDRTQIKLDSV